MPSMTEAVPTGGPTADSMASPMILADGIHKRFGANEVLKGVSLLYDYTLESSASNLTLQLGSARANPRAEALSEGRAAGLDLEGGQLAVLWNRGAMGLVYAFEEVLGAEIIVDGHVVARVLRGQHRKEIDLDAPDADAF